MVTWNEKLCQVVTKNMEKIKRLPKREPLKIGVWIQDEKKLKNPGKTKSSYFPLPFLEEMVSTFYLFHWKKKKWLDVLSVGHIHRLLCIHMNVYKLKLNVIIIQVILLIKLTYSLLRIIKINYLSAKGNERENKFYSLEILRF